MDESLDRSRSESVARGRAGKWGDRMLLFVDQPKTIKVLRLLEEGGSVRRVRVGGVQKNKLELSEELTKDLNADEISEVKNVIAFYGSKDDAQLKLDVSRFPEILRQVVTYMSRPEVPEIERRLLATALSEALRQLRKSERGEDAKD